MTTAELVPYENAAPPTLFGTNKPSEVVELATEQANALAGVVRDKHLYADISGRKHVTVEGWTLLGTMLGVFPVCTWTKLIENGWEARVEARTLNGQVVGAAEAQCTHDEKMWATRDEYALRSMAQTRATSKALRLPLGFVMVLAGYEATPAEEMPRDEAPARPQQPSRPAPPVGEEHELRDPETYANAPVKCAYCHGPTYDNRGKKSQGTYKATSPDYACQNKDACGGIAWENADGLNWKKGT